MTHHLYDTIMCKVAPCREIDIHQLELSSTISVFGENKPISTSAVLIFISLNNNYIHPSIHQLSIPLILLRVIMVATANPSWRWARGGVLPGQVTAISESCMTLRLRYSFKLSFNCKVRRLSLLSPSVSAQLKWTDQETRWDFLISPGFGQPSFPFHHILSKASIWIQIVLGQYIILVTISHVQ